jgi:hypothetical protein
LIIGNYETYSGAEKIYHHEVKSWFFGKNAVVPKELRRELKKTRHISTLD